MHSGEKIGSYGAVSLITTLIITKALISAPSLYAKQSGPAGWLEVLLSGIFEVIILSIILKFMSQFDDMDLIDIARYTFGKVGSLIVGAGASVVFLISGAAVFRSFAELVRDTVIRGISYEAISIFVLAAGIVAGIVGLKTQINLNGLILPGVIASLIIIALINFSRYSLSNILPLFGTGITNVAKNAVLKNSSFFELGIFLFLAPYLGGFSRVKKTCFTALIFSVLLSSVIALCYQLAVPYEAASTFALPLYQMTRMIKAGTFFQRIEPLNVFIWGGTMLLYIGICIYMAAFCHKKAFNIKDSKPLTYVFAQIICSLALIPGSETNVERIYDFLLTYSYVAYPILPLFLLIIFTAFSKKKAEV